MIISIICYYTNSNEINPVGAFLSLILMGIFIAVAIRIWIGNKIDDYKYSSQVKKRNAYLTEEALKIVDTEAKKNENFYRIKYTYNWKQWFIKGYIHGATWGNYYNSPYTPIKRESDFTIDEWEKHEVMTMEHIKEDSEYFGGNKELAIYAFFQGHKFGLMRFGREGKAE